MNKYGFDMEIPEDELTALERGRLYGEGKEVDRIPCCLDTGETMAPMLGFSIADYYHNSQMMCDLEVHNYRTFGTDGVGLSTTLRGMAEAMGAKVRYSDKNVALIEAPGLALEDAENAKEINVDTDGRFHIILEGLAKIKKEIGNECPISATVTGPFSVAANLVGTDRLLVGMLKKPEKVKVLMEIITENNNRYIRRLLDLGVGIGFADPVSSTTLIRKKQYEKFSLPYIRRNMEFIRDNGGGCGLHICGQSREIWEDLITLPMGCFGLDNVESLTEAKEVLGPHMGIQGNVPPVDVMRYGTPKEVVLSAKECIEQAWDSPRGYTLTSGCQMPIDTPVENIHALMDAARMFGRPWKN